MPGGGWRPAGGAAVTGVQLTAGALVLRPWVPEDDATLGSAVFAGSGRLDVDLAVTLDGGRPVGRLGVARLADAVAELYWWVDPSHRRQGHGRTAVRRLVRWCLAEQGLARVQAHIDADDIASLALATGCGLRPEGLLRGARSRAGDRVDVVVRGLLREDLVGDEADIRWAAVRAGLPTKAVAAGVLARSDDGRALVLETSYKVHWEVPGGLVEPNEGLVAAARREVQEELGGALPVGDLLLVDACGVSGAHSDIVCLLFDGGVHGHDLVERLAYPDGEILRAHWVGRDQLLDRCGPRLGRRVAAGLDAFVSGRLPGPALVLHDGQPDAG